MNALYAINGLVYILICFVIIKYLLKEYDEKLKKILNWYFVILGGYLILIFYSIAWFLDFFSYNAKDFNLIYSITIFIQTLVLFKIVYSFNRDKKMLYYLLTYLLIFISVLIAEFSFLLLIISYLLSLILSLNFLNYHKQHANIGYSGIAYSSVSLFLQFLLFYRIGNSLIFSIISSLFFLIFSFYFLRDAGDYSIKPSEAIKSREESRLLLFIKYFIYIIVLTNIILISTIGIHELGHVVISRFYGCESRSIFYEEGNYPYSEIVCDDLSDKTYIALAGPIIPIIISLFLFFLGGSFIKSISFIILGFNLLASYKDLFDIGISENIVFAISILGVVSLFIGITLLARSRMQEN